MSDRWQETVARIRDEIREGIKLPVSEEKSRDDHVNGVIEEGLVRAIFLMRTSDILERESADLLDEMARRCRDELLALTWTSASEPLPVVRGFLERALRMGRGMPKRPVEGEIVDYVASLEETLDGAAALILARTGRAIDEWGDGPRMVDVLAEVIPEPLTVEHQAPAGIVTVDEFRAIVREELAAHLGEPGVVEKAIRNLRPVCGRCGGFEDAPNPHCMGHG